MAILQTGKVGIPPIQINPLGYAGDQENVVPITNADRIPTGLDRNYSTGTEWFVNTTQDTWKLYGFIDGLANWKILSSGSVPGGTVISLSGDADVQVFPDGIGNIQLEGTAGQITVTEDPANNKLVFALTGGGTGIDSINVDASTPPGTDPVVADGTGQITVTGSAVAQAGIPIQSASRAANTVTIEVQRSNENASSSAAIAGISSYDSAAFQVDANGWVQLVGGSIPPVQTINVQASTPPGTDPVVPTAAGQITVNGSVVAAHSIPIQTNSLAANTYNVETQYTSAIASTDATKVGFASFDISDFSADANGFVALQQPGVGFTNLGIAYSSSTFRVTSASGSPLSATNVGTVTIPSLTTPGSTKTYNITADSTFIDDSGASTIVGNDFGNPLTTWLSNMPFFIYAVANSAETDVAFAICRLPSSLVSPTAGNSGRVGTPNADQQYSFFYLGTPTLSDYASRPCLRIGWFQMQMTTVPADWTVQPLSVDGMNNLFLNGSWEMPKGTMGAAANTWFLANGGTAPVFAGLSTLIYVFTDNEEIELYLNFSDDAGTGTAGLGSVNSLIAVPFIPTGSRSIGTQLAITGTYTVGTFMMEATGNQSMALRKVTDGVNVQNADWTASGKNFLGNGRYIPNRS